MLDRFVDVVALCSCVNTSKIRRNANNSKEPQQKYRLGMVSMKILGGGLNWFYGYPTLPSASVMAQNSCPVRMKVF